MFQKADRQRSFFDPSIICGHLIDEDSFYHTLNEFGSRIISDEDFKEMYCNDNGRPSIPPSIMARIILLQLHDDVSDREAANHAIFDVRWKHALDVSMDWEGFDHSTLVKFRARLLAHNVEGVAFESLNQLAVKLGLIDSENLHAMDSTNILGAAQVKNTYDLIREAIVEILQGVEQIPDLDALAVFSEEKAKTYRTKQKSDIDWQDPEARRQHLQVLVRDACQLLRAINKLSLPEDTQASQAAGLLEKILRTDVVFPEGKDVESFGEPEAEVGDEDDQDPEDRQEQTEEESFFEQQTGEDQIDNSRPSQQKKESGEDQKENDQKKKEIAEEEEEKAEEQKESTEEENEVRLDEGAHSDRIISVVDPEMRHGRKSSSKRWDGFKGHIVVDLESEWVSATLLDQANNGDGEVGEDPLDKVQKMAGYQPDHVMADAAYGSGDNRAEYQDRGVNLISPVPEATNRYGFSKDDFDIDLEEEEVTCPSGETTSKWHQDRDPKGRPIKRFKFDRQVCGACELQQQCTTAKNGRTIKLNYHEEELQEDRQYQETEEFKKQYRQRPRVEGKISEIFNRHGMRQSRYIGKRKTALQMMWTAAVVNLKRLPKLIEKMKEDLSEQGSSARAKLKRNISPTLVPI